MGNFHSRYLAGGEQAAGQLASQFHYINDREHRAYF